MTKKIKIKYRYFILMILSFLFFVFGLVITAKTLITMINFSNYQYDTLTHLNFYIEEVGRYQKKFYTIKGISIKTGNEKSYSTRNLTEFKYYEQKYPDSIPMIKVGNKIFLTNDLNEVKRKTRNRLIRGLIYILPFIFSSILFIRNSNQVKKYYKQLKQERLIK